MKKIIYAILICVIIAGIAIIATVGLNADIIYSKNVEIEIYVDKIFEKADIENIVKEVFPGERAIVQEVDLFQDTVAITLEDNRTDEELNAKIEELNTRINEKYEVENSVEDIIATHNPKVKLSSLIIPYVVTVGISMIIMLIYVCIRYRALGVIKTLVTYILSIGASEMLLLSIIAITRFPINRIVIPVGLLLLVVVITILGFINERKLLSTSSKGNSKKKIK